MTSEQTERIILVVEDDADMREAMLLILAAAEVTAKGASNGQEALDQLRAGLRPCLILLDLMMPVMTGWELDEKLAADPELSSIPVVFVSAGGVPAPTARPTKYLTKPVAVDLLLETVRAYCDGRRIG